MRDKPHEGKACIKMRFVGEHGTWVGVAWQHPANDWGEQEGGYDLRGATYLELWARGRIRRREDQHRRRSPRPGQGAPGFRQDQVEDIRLTKEWQRYRIRLKKLDLSSIKTGFVVTLSGRGRRVTVYLDSIRFVRK